MSTLNIRLDEQDKIEFNEFCKENGLTMGAAVNLFIKKTVNEWRIPFEIGGKRMSASEMRAQREAEEIIAHPENYKWYSSVDDLMEAAESDGED